MCFANNLLNFQWHFQRGEYSCTSDTFRCKFIRKIREFEKVEGSETTRVYSCFDVSIVQFLNSQCDFSLFLSSLISSFFCPPDACLLITVSFLYSQLFKLLLFPLYILYKRWLFRKSALLSEPKYKISLKIKY